MIVGVFQWEKKREEKRRQNNGPEEAARHLEVPRGSVGHSEHFPQACPSKDGCCDCVLTTASIAVFVAAAAFAMGIFVVAVHDDTRYVANRHNLLPRNVPSPQSRTLHVVPTVIAPLVQLRPMSVPPWRPLPSVLRRHKISLEGTCVHNKSRIVRM